VEFWFALPELVNTEPLPWWGYAAISLLFLVGGGVVRLELLHYRAVQTGKLIPRITMDLIVAAKDTEIERLQRDVERWNGAYHITHQAYVELSQSVDDLTDVMRGTIDQRPVREIPPTRTVPNSEAANRDRRSRERA
jgi:hypothetical protein